MNIVNLIGRLTKDVVLKKTTNGTSVVRFSLAVNRVKEGADFINCVAYNQTSDLMNKYLAKGSQIAVQGRINTRNYDNEKGERVYVTEVIADRIEFLDKKESGEEREETETWKSQAQHDGLISSDDLPF
ncbi:MAG: single-stranded DNA-binding protein [Erysipelotrichaceae bacterium]|nr:single-stranded DNA-binding protein [Erysipelotrichaceae bacterium]